MPPQAIVVTREEAGQKLLQFLARRFALPQAMLHRWIRSGQVRRNGGRCKPFDRLEMGDEVRVPPFAASMSERADVGPVSANSDAVRNVPDAAAPRPAPSRHDRDGHDAMQPSRQRRPKADTSIQPARPLPPVVAETPDLFIFDKPAGLAVHPGTGHTDSLTTRLAQHFAKAPFMPTPAHRLDRDTSGLLLVARSYAMLRTLHEAFASHDALVKEYLAWVAGCWQPAAPVTLHDRLSKGAEASGFERVASDDEGAEAACTVRCLLREQHRSLLLVTLHTGRTHQIRVQLSRRGHPLLGDRKYGGPPRMGGFLLHAVRLCLPSGVVHTLLPRWAGNDALPQGFILPEPLGPVPASAIHADSACPCPRAPSDRDEGPDREEADTDTVTEGRDA
ncbi:MAG TPA: RluA family pseudouridine synthase [Desulfovibrio sp.]|nr:RluA family pseudouridine synthase [Desulfovibrio sp.]